jgi:DNA processing protein
MIEPLTSNTQAILLLTAPLVAGRGESSTDLLTLGEYNKLARILREKQKQPADLIGPAAQDLLELCAHPFGRARLDALLGRGFLLSQAVERWNARAIWVLSRADSRYPKRIKSRLKEDAPPLLYGSGETALLEKGGLAVVGSRHVDDELISFTEKVGCLVARAHRTIRTGAMWPE